MAKTPITNADLKAHLDEQLGFLERSASSFDQDYEDEAKRLAVTLRVLLHETHQSHSLLGQLGSRSGSFVDTALPNDAANLMPHGGLVFTAMGPPRTRYVAMLDDVPVTKQVPFEDWWNAPVFIDRDRNALTRKELVLIAANQDGGAHVDPALDDTYRKLAKENSLNLVAVENGKARQMDGPERAAIRQMAHEVLKTLKPNYTKKQAHQASVFVSSPSLLKGAHPPAVASRKVSESRKVGRNAPCPCGSGRKYKKCCGSLKVP